MEVHSAGKRLWNILRIALIFMVRKGIMSKRKLLMDMNLMMKRGKQLRKTLANLIFHHSRSHPPPPPSPLPRGSGGFRFRLQDYEFSCSNSPNPVFSHVAKRKHHCLNFPCINPPSIDKESDIHRDDMDMAVLVLPNNNNHHQNKKQQLPHDHPSPEPGFRFDAPTPDYLGPGEALSPLLSPFSVRISNYSSEGENDGGDANSRVDDDAEEFIRRFYEQLRVQSRTQMLQYEEEMQYQEMLARGTR